MRTIREFINLVEEQSLPMQEPSQGSYDPKDTVELDVPLLIRLFEYAREDSQDDKDLHNLAERMIALSAEGRALTMNDYDTLISPGQGTEGGPDPSDQFDQVEEMVERLAKEYAVDSETIWEDFADVDDDTLLEVAAWKRKEGKSKTGGLNAKGVASYRRENPGSKLQMAVTTKPSKLKPGSKAAKRRKSFCARMGGVKGPMKDKNGKPTRKALALRKWNCHEAVEEGLRDPKDNPCWKGYKPVGTKKKSGKTVPNCVPKKHKP